MRAGRFALAAAAASGLVVIAAAAATYVAALTVPCQLHVAWFDIVRAACSTDLWPFASYPWLALGLLAGLVIGWLLAAASAVTRQLSAAERMLRSMPAVTDAHALLSDGAERAGLRRVGQVRTSHPVAFTHGLLRPRVVISTGLTDLLDTDQLQAVLEHEAAHVRRRDPLRLLFLRTIVALTFPLPVIQDLAAQAEIDIELAADRAAVRRVGVAPLAGALRALLNVGQGSRQAAIAGIDPEAARVEHLTAGSLPRRSITPRRVAVSVLSTVVLVALTAPALIADRSSSPTYVTVESDGR